MCETVHVRSAVVVAGTTAGSPAVRDLDPGPPGAPAMASPNAHVHGEPLSRADRQRYPHLDQRLPRAGQ